MFPSWEQTKDGPFFQVFCDNSCKYLDYLEQVRLAYLKDLIAFF